MCNASVIENIKTVAVSDEVTTEYYFPSPIYSVTKTNLVPAALLAANERLDASKKERPKLNALYPVRMTDSFPSDPRVAELTESIGQISWGILSGQGHNMENTAVVFHEFWCQEHHRHSAMPEHIHANGAQIVGFYFLETPKDCSKVVLHDPRPGKKQINIAETNMQNATAASTAIHFTPTPGMLLFTNAWLPHSFSRHGSVKPIKFIHFTLGLQYNAPSCPVPAVEII
jgi:hypothetical protein